MTRSAKYFSICFLSIFFLVFFQVEKVKAERVVSKNCCFSNDNQFSSDLPDDAIQIATCDDDGDDATEIISKITPTTCSILFSSINTNCHSQVIYTLSRNYSHRDVSPNFLKVFRI